MQKPTTPDAECLPQERQRLILERLAREGRVVAQELAQQFRTSEDTIRRDLRELAAAGLCHRVYGGALPLSPVATTRSEHEPLMPARQQALGEALAGLLSPGDVVFIDAGATNLAAMRAVPETLPLTVVTNAPRIAAELAERETIHVVVIGGLVDRRTGSTFAARALRDIGDLRPDVYLLGSCALDTVTGIGVYGFDEAEFKRAMLAQSRRVIAAASSDKLGVGAPFAVAPLRALRDLVVEADAPAETVGLFQQEGVNIHRAAAVPGSAS